MLSGQQVAKYGCDLSLRLQKSPLVNLTASPTVAPNLEASKFPKTTRKVLLRTQTFRSRRARGLVPRTLY